jgi:hypothetical protein
MTSLIDFESRFREYLRGYRQKHDIGEDAMEEIVPELYLRWLEMPHKELDGKSPAAYFDSFSGADLVMQLGQYFFSELQIPGALLNRIADTRAETYPYVVSLLQNYVGERGDEFRKLLVELIEEMKMPHPCEYYIGVIAAAEESGEFSEACVDALKTSGGAVRDALLKAFEDAGREYSQDCFLDILSDMPYDERVYAHALEKFLYGADKRAFYAGCLGKLGNEKALPYLEEALKQEDLTYYDYISIKNALEELGGEADIERDFTGDKDYDALADMEE